PLPGLKGQSPRFRARWAPPEGFRAGMRIGKISPYLRHVGIEGERFFEVGECLVVGLLALRLVPELGPGFAGVIDGIEILRPAMCSALALCLLELEIEGVRYLPGHLRLEGKQILSTPVEAFRPEIRTRLCIEELHGHAHLALGTAHAAFQDITHAQL